MDRQTTWWTAAGASGLLALATAIGATAELSAQAKKAGRTQTAAATPSSGPRGASAPAGRGPSAEMVERGRYLVTTGACGDCHTPWKLTEKGHGPDMDRMLSGHPESFTLTPPPRATGPWVIAMTYTNTAHAGPWGVSFSANLTPDKETGLGNWTEEMFVSAIRTGKHAGVHRPILPPMPWPAYAQMTDQDLQAMFAYLQSIKPVRNAVPPPVPPTPTP